MIPSRRRRSTIFCSRCRRRLVAARRPGRNLRRDERKRLQRGDHGRAVPDARERRQRLRAGDTVHFRTGTHPGGSIPFVPAPQPPGSRSARCRRAADLDGAWRRQRRIRATEHGGFLHSPGRDRGSAISGPAVLRMELLSSYIEDPEPASRRATESMGSRSTEDVGQLHSRHQHIDPEQHHRAQRKPTAVLVERVIDRVTGTHLDNQVIGNASFENIDVSSHHSDGSGFILDFGSTRVWSKIHRVPKRRVVLARDQQLRRPFINNTCYHDGLDTNDTAPALPGEDLLGHDGQHERRGAEQSARRGHRHERVQPNHRNRARSEQPAVNANAATPFFTDRRTSTSGSRPVPPRSSTEASPPARLLPTLASIPGASRCSRVSRSRGGSTRLTTCTSRASAAWLAVFIRRPGRRAPRRDRRYNGGPVAPGSGGAPESGGRFRTGGAARCGRWQRRPVRLRWPHSDRRDRRWWRNECQRRASRHRRSDRHRRQRQRRRQRQWQMGPVAAELPRPPAEREAAGQGTTGPGASDGAGAAGGCGCSSVTSPDGFPVAATLVAWLLWLGCRRRAAATPSPTAGVNHGVSSG